MHSYGIKIICYDHKTAYFPSLETWECLRNVCMEIIMFNNTDIVFSCVCHFKNKNYLKYIYLLFKYIECMLCVCMHLSV